MDVSKHLEKAADAVRKKNFDYAISLYHQVLTIRPDHGEARAALREALVRRYEYKKIPRALALIQGLHHRLGVAIGRLLKKPAQVIQSAEGYLRSDPRNASVNAALAEALEAAGHPHSAVAVWEFLGDDPAIGDYALKRAGQIYYSIKEMEKALGCFEAVLKRSPRDSEAEKMRKNLAAEGVLSSGSYDPSRSSRELARDKEGLRQREIEQKVMTSEDERAVLRERLEQAVEKDPSDKRARRTLVEFLVKNKEYDAAIEVLEAGLQFDPESFEISERLGDVKILRLEQQLREARRRANKGDEAAAADVVRLERELVEFQIEEYRRRIQQHPTDLDLRFRLGKLLLQTGRIDEAIEAFQHSVKDPRRRIDSLLGLGTSFRKKGLHDLARKQFDTALAAVDEGSDRAVEITYAIALLLEESGDVEGARSRYESIYERDIHYRDVEERLHALSSRGARTPPTTGTDATGERPAVAERESESAAGVAESAAGTSSDDAEGSPEDEDQAPPRSIYEFKD